MNKTILVIGSVTAKQYEPFRLEILRQGHKPKIVRLSNNDFSPDYETLADIYQSPEEAEYELESFLEGHESETSLVELVELLRRHYSTVIPEEDVYLVILGAECAQMLRQVSIIMELKEAEQAYLVCTGETAQHWWYERAFIPDGSVYPKKSPFDSKVPWVVT